MKKATKRLPILLNKPLMPPSLALRKVTSKKGYGVYASSDTLYIGAIFGRDSIETAEDLLSLRPRLVRRIIKVLASLQGELHNTANEEEPGKIIHEYRSIYHDGKKLSGVPLHLFQELSKRWGGDDQELVYYGAIDATPHFVRLVFNYCRLHGDKILKNKIRLRSGHWLSLKLVLENSLDWILKSLEESKSGLLEYRRVNPLGIENQVWKDSKEFYIHENGQFANHKAPIASIEVQALVYDSLALAGEVFPARAEFYMGIAQTLRDRVIDLFWQEDRNYFALGLDYDNDNKLRIISTPTANPAALLDSLFFKDINDEAQKKYVTGVVSKIMSKDFLTDAGIRSRSLSASHLLNYWDYHGSFVTWPKETHDIAKGLRRQGFPLLAKELENRLLNVVMRSRNYLEFVYVDEYGRVLAGPPTKQEHGEIMLIDSANNPESVQTWTVSAVMAIIATRLNNKLRRAKPAQTDWQIALEQQFLSKIPRIKKMVGPWTLAAKYPKYPYKVVKINSHASTDMPGR